MLNYAATHVFTPFALRMLDKAQRCIEKVPDSFTDVRCHELARAVRFVLRVDFCDVMDGKFAEVYEHSWLELHQPNRRTILDVYAVGRLPQVQLVDGDSRNGLHYAIGATRKDINTTMVGSLVHAMEL